MAELSNQIDYLDYIARYKSRHNPSQWTWTELEARFKQLVAKYEVRWPDIPIKLKKYSAIYRLIETYWDMEWPFPHIEEFSFQDEVWPTDACTEPRNSSSSSSKPTRINTDPEDFADRTTQIAMETFVITGEASGPTTEISQTAGQLCKAAMDLCQVSWELSKVFE